MRQLCSARPSSSIAALALLAAAIPASADLTFSVEGTWDTAQRRQAAVDAMTNAVGHYNAHGGFNKHLRVTYNSGVPTADGNYNGSIRFGGSYPSTGLALHEIAHTLGVGTTQAYQNNRNSNNNKWTGPNAIEKVEQFDGLGSQLNADNFHFYPYGLNYSNEYSTLNFDRHVATVYQMGRDMNLSPFTSAANFDSVVTLTANDPNGQSSFNRNARWSDGQFAHEGAAYFTGDFQLRTPSQDANFRFAGDSLTLNNTVNTASDTLNGLVFITPGGNDDRATITVDNLILDGGSVANRGNETQTTFRLDGNVDVVSSGTFHPHRGRIDVFSALHGDGDLTILPGQTPDDTLQAVRFWSPDSTFSGNLHVDGGRFGLANGAAFNFDLNADGTGNAITGDEARLVYLDGVFNLSLPDDPMAGISWSLVDVNPSTRYYGPNFDISGFTRDGGTWTDGTYTFTQSTGLLTINAIPEPATAGLLLTGAGLLLLRRRA